MVRAKNQGADRFGQGAIEATLGHDAEGFKLPRPARKDRRRHPDGYGNPRPAQERARQCAVGVRQHLSGSQALRTVRENGFARQVRHHHVVFTNRVFHQRRRKRRGVDGKTAAIRHLQKDAGGLV